MRKATLRELHLNTSSIIREVEEGQVFVIQKQGVPVAELRPLAARPPTRGFPDMEAFLARFPKVRTDSGRILEEDRS